MRKKNWKIIIKNYLICVKNEEKTVKKVKMHKFLVCACKSQDYAQSQKFFARSHDRTTARFRNSAWLPYQYHITINFAFLSQFLLYFNYTKVLYYVVISLFIVKTFVFTKQTFAQTKYDIYKFILLLNRGTISFIQLWEILVLCYKIYSY